MKHTAEEVRYCVESLVVSGCSNSRALTNGIKMLRAYAADLDRRAEGVAAEGHIIRVLSHDGECEVAARWEGGEGAYVTLDAIRGATDPDVKTPMSVAAEPAQPTHCQCPACTITHDAGCAVHNMPAMPNGPCDCGAIPLSIDIAVAGNLIALLREAVSFIDPMWDDSSAFIERVNATLSVAAEPSQPADSGRVGDKRAECANGCPPTQVCDYCQNAPVWRAEWAGSEPGRGWYIREGTHPTNAPVVAYLGDNIDKVLVRETVEAHNATVNRDKALAAQGQGEPVAKVRHFDYRGISRNGFSQEAEMLDGAPVLPDGTPLYTHPAPPASPASPAGVPDARIIDLAERLVAAGPKAAHVSASECHEISDFILSLSAAPSAPEGDGGEG